MNRLAGKVALISGGARGQGATETRLFVGEGAAVVFGDVLDDDGKKLEAEIRGSGGQATYVHLDVTREADSAGRGGHHGAGVRQAQRAGQQRRHSVPGQDRGHERGGLGSHHGRQRQGRVPRNEVRPVRDAQRRAAAPSSTSSTAGLVGSPGGTAAYTATKGAVRLFTKSTAVQHARDKIRCNSVHPGPIATDMIKDILEGPAWEQRLRRLPMGRVGTPEEVAYGVLYSPPTNRPT